MTASAPWFRWQGEALILDLSVQPGAKRGEVVGLHGDTLKVRIQAPPVDGRANRALVEFIAETFGVPRTRVGVIRGAASRTKTLSIDRPTTLPASLIALGLIAK